SDRKTIGDMLKNLKNIQDILGEIHDSDIIIDYFKNMKQKSKYSEIVDAEILERNKKYKEFVFRMKKLGNSTFEL
ncbi:MAG: hypothetical protein KGH76_05210, partial [Thaumarchaeota archaeon]|nr:hypothetical protein [Nitrososphaerota archaeon]